MLLRRVGEAGLEKEGGAMSAKLEYGPFAGEGMLALLLRREGEAALEKEGGAKSAKLAYDPFAGAGRGIRSCGMLPLFVHVKYRD